MTTNTPANYLAEWFARYTKNRDLILRKLSELRQEENKVILTQKDGLTVHYYAEPFPEDLVRFAQGINEEHKGVLMYNTPNNFKQLVSGWKKLASIPNLIIYFVNPFSKQDKKWIIRPYVHDKISDPQSLETGLNSMYLMVDSTTQKEIEQLTK